VAEYVIQILAAYLLPLLFLLVGAGVCVMLVRRWRDPLAPESDAPDRTEIDPEAAERLSRQVRELDAPD
jgi:hypothetical protein